MGDGREWENGAQCRQMQSSPLVQSEIGRPQATPIALESRRVAPLNLGRAAGLALWLRRGLPLGLRSVFSEIVPLPLNRGGDAARSVWRRTVGLLLPPSRAARERKRRSQMSRPTITLARMAASIMAGGPRPRRRARPLRVRVGRRKDWGISGRRRLREAVQAGAAARWQADALRAPASARGPPSWPRRARSPTWPADRSAVATPGDGGPAQRRGAHSSTDALADALGRKHAARSPAGSLASPPTRPFSGRARQAPIPGLRRPGTEASAQANPRSPAPPTPRVARPAARRDLRPRSTPRSTDACAPSPRA